MVDLGKSIQLGKGILKNCNLALRGLTRRLSDIDYCNVSLTFAKEMVLDLA